MARIKAFASKSLIGRSDISSRNQQTFQFPCHIGERQRRQVPLRNDNNVQGNGKSGSVEPEKFSQEPFDAVSFNRVPNFPADGESQPADTGGTAGRYNGKVSRVAANPPAVDGIVLFFPADPLVSAKGLSDHALRMISPAGLRHPALPVRKPVSHRQALPALGSSPAQDLPAPPGGHSHQETVGPLPLQIRCIL